MAAPIDATTMELELEVAIPEPEVPNTESQPSAQPVLLTEGTFSAEEGTPGQNGEAGAAENGAPAPPPPEETLSEKMESLEKELASDDEDRDQLKYVPPLQDPYSRSVKYMEKHNVMQIFQHLTAEIVYHKPTDPLQHMLEELTRMVAERETKREEVLKSAGIA